MKAIHAVSAVLWQPGEQTHVSQTNKQTNKQTHYYTRGRPRAPRVITIVVYFDVFLVFAQACLRKRLSFLMSGRNFETDFEIKCIPPVTR